MKKYLEKVVRIDWRGTARETAPSPEQEELRKDRVLLLVGGGNRAPLIRHLQDSYTLVETEESRITPGSFDIAIVDIAGLRKWRDQLIDEKVRSEPTFLPIVLVLSNRELRYRIKTFWDIIDEFIIAPIDPREFSERVLLLLRTRHLALTQREHLAYLVNHDRLTGLPNKNLFMERLGDSIRDAAILGKQLHVAVIYVPMARIVQSLGHKGLERIASQYSSRLLTLARNDAYLARLATDEWGLIFRPGETLAKVHEVCTKIQHMSLQPIETDGEHVHLSARIGISAYPEDGADAASVLDSAASALSSANGHSPVYYSRNVQHDALRFIRTQTRLYEALEEQQFELWFQPQIRFSTGQVEGVEALVRWRLPTGELVPPGGFLPVAEATGQIVGIDHWVLGQACAIMTEWGKERLPIKRVSVNITVADIESPNFVEYVQGVLRKYELPPPSLELELTETALLETSKENLEKLNQLRAYGISMAIDDFGKGYSSLGYLHTLPITTLKIDKAFVDNVATSTTDAAIAETIVWLAKKFQLDTVAEGVENQEQADFLKKLGVTTAQGYLYGRPMPDHQLREWLKNRR